MSIDYNQAASQYAANRRIHPPVFQALRTGLPPGAQVLEVGCGTGNYIIALQELTGCQAWGIDPSRGMLARARQRGAPVQFGLGTGEQLPCADGSFDLVFSVDVIHHIQDRPAYYRQAARVLRTGGRICTVTDSEEIIHTRQPLAVYFPETVPVELRRYPPVLDLLQQMEQAGFVRLRQETVSLRSQITTSQAYRDKAFSSLHLIPEEAFQRGLRRMEADLARGPLPWVSRYVLLWGEKSQEE